MGELFIPWMRGSAEHPKFRGVTDGRRLVNACIRGNDIYRIKQHFLYLFDGDTHPAFIRSRDGWGADYFGYSPEALDLDRVKEVVSDIELAALLGLTARLATVGTANLVDLERQLNAHIRIEALFEQIPKALEAEELHRSGGINPYAGTNIPTWVMCQNDGKEIGNDATIYQTTRGKVKYIDTCNGKVVSEMQRRARKK